MPASRLATLVPLPAPDGDYRVLVDVLVEISRGVDLTSTFRAAAQGVTRLTSFDWMGIAWRGPRAQQTTLHASLSGRPDWLATSQELDAGSGPLALWFLPELPRILGPNRPALAAEDPAWPVPGDINALITIPLPRTGGGSRARDDRSQRRGALLLGRTRRAFEPGLVTLLEPVAAQLGVLLEKAEWVERFRATIAELRERMLDSVADRPLELPRGPAAARSRDFVAQDPRALEALELVERAAATDLSVLLDGESGTGKELMARTLHALSPRRDKPFVAVNVAALTQELAGSELFGHRAGSFTGARGERKGLVEEAHGGTLFLDEVGDMPAALQPVLLRFLEEGELRRVGENQPRAVDARIVCATNRDLLADLVAGRFREDLYHRLAEVTVRLPPLRERPEDLALLTRRFLRDGSAGRYPELPESWWPAFRQYHWPGNVRELRNAMRSVGALSRGEQPETRFLPPPLRDALEGSRPRAADPYPGWTLAEVERETIRKALLATDGHRGRAAARLGLAARSLYAKVRRYGLDSEAPPGREPGPTRGPTRG